MVDLILPGDIRYEMTLAHPSLFLLAQNDKKVEIAGWVYDCETGLPRATTQTEMLDYIYGGEYEERLENEGFSYEEEFEILKYADPNKPFYIDI